MDDLERENYIAAINDAIGKEKLTHFAKRAGVSAGNLSRIRKGQIAKPHILRKIAEASENVSYDDLMKAAGFTSADALADIEVRSYRRGLIRVPVIGDKELALLGEQPIFNAAFPYEELYVSSLDEEDHYIYYVAKDDAVVPAGSRVLVDITRKPQGGDIALFSHDGETLLRHLTKTGYSFFYFGNDLQKFPMTPTKKSLLNFYGVAIRANIDL